MCNFHPLKGVGRGSEPQLQVGENLNNVTLRGNVRDCTSLLNKYGVQI